MRGGITTKDLAILADERAGLLGRDLAPDAKPVPPAVDAFNRGEHQPDGTVIMPAEPAPTTPVNRQLEIYVKGAAYFVQFPFRILSLVPNGLLEEASDRMLYLESMAVLRDNEMESLQSESMTARGEQRTSLIERTTGLVLNAMPEEIRLCTYSVYHAPIACELLADRALNTWIAGNRYSRNYLEHCYISMRMQEKRDGDEATNPDNELHQAFWALLAEYAEKRRRVGTVGMYIPLATMGQVRDTVMLYQPDQSGEQSRHTAVLQDHIRYYLQLWNNQGKATLLRTQLRRWEHSILAVPLLTQCRWLHALGFTIDPVNDCAKMRDLIKEWPGHHHDQSGFGRRNYHGSFYYYLFCRLGMARPIEHGIKMLASDNRQDWRFFTTMKKIGAAEAYVPLPDGRTVKLGRQDDDDEDDEPVQPKKYKTKSAPTPLDDDDEV